MEKDILDVIRYFDRFDYPPTSEEIFTFISRSITSGLLNKQLEILVRQQKLITSRFTAKFSRFALHHRRQLFALQKTKEKISKNKIKKINLYLKVLLFFPQIKLIGLSGSMAMMSASGRDDIDLFIITAKNRLFTGRFITVLLAQIMGIRRKRGSATQMDKVCLNLFIDERSLEVPRQKKTPFVGHEILQMKPIINKDNIYQKFLLANRWVIKIFPNAKSKLKTQNLKSQVKSQKSGIYIFDIMEKMLKKLQLYFINKHKTRELISDTQLWFHPIDYSILLRPEI